MSTEYRRIKNRRDTSAGWIEKNPVLLEGELGLETDTRKIKFGDGVNYWIDLPYSGVDSQEITDIVTNISYTKNEVNQIVNTVEGSIPTDTSDLTNGAGYITINDVPAQQQADWTEVNTTVGSYIKNKPNLATVATSGDYTDLSNTPTIPTDTSDLTNGAGFITQADVKSYKAFPAGWHTSGTMANLISDINSDQDAVIGMSYMATVSFSDLPAGLQQAEIKVDVMDKLPGLGKNILFTVTSSDTAPYHWEYTSAYGASGTWRDWLPNVTLATVATSGSYNDLTDKPSIPGQVQADWNEADPTNVAYIQNKPTIPTDTSDLTNNAGFITINDVPAQQQANWTETNTTLGSYIQNKPNLATVATSGDYTDLTNKPTIPTDTSDLTNGAGFITLNEVPGQLQADWTEVNSTLGSYIQNKPTVYNEWFGTQQEYDAIVVKDADTIYHIEGAATVTWNEVVGKPTFAAVATSGDYTDLTNKPTIPTNTSDLNNDSGFITISDVPAQQQADWTEADSTDPSYIQNKPTIPTVNDATVTFTQGGVTKGSVTLNQGTDATIALDAGGGTQVNADWNESDPTDPAYIENKPTLATVATSGSYTDLINTPSIPAAQVNSDWNANSGVAQILNKPTIPTVPPMATELLTFTLSDLSTISILVYIVPEPFYIKDLSGSDNTLSIVKNNASAPTIEVFSSTDMKNWTSMGTTSTTAITATIPANGKLYLKAAANNWGNNLVIYNNITASGNHNVGGNIMSLLAGDNYEGATLNSNYSYQFRNLFYDNTHLVDASNLELPSNVAEGCYRNMFERCSALTTAPALPATTLQSNCYYGMFYGCTSLTQAPALPATTLATSCYQNMFGYCTSLNSVTTYANDISATSCLSSWLLNVAATGDFYNLGTATYTTDSPSGIPSGWTEHTSL